MAFKKINTSEQYLNDKFFLYTFVRGGKYFLQTEKGELEISVDAYAALKTGRPEIAKDKFLVDLKGIAKAFKKADGQGGGPAVGTPLETNKTYTSGDSNPIYFNINYDTATLKAWLQTKEDAGLFNENNTLVLNTNNDFLAIQDMSSTLELETPFYALTVSTGAVIWISDDLSVPEAGITFEAGWYADKPSIVGTKSLDANGKWINETTTVSMELGEEIEDIPFSEWNGVWVSETPFAGGSVSYKYYLELTNGIIIEADKATYDAIVAHTDEYSEYEFYALNDVYYNKDYINRVQNGVAELVNGDKIALKDAEKSAISGEGSAFRAIGEGGGSAEGTPLETDKTYTSGDSNPIYFNINYDTDTLKAWCQAKKTAGLFDGDSLSLGSTSDENKIINIYDLNEDGSAYVITFTSGDVIWASDEIDDEGDIIPKGWQANKEVLGQINIDANGKWVGELEGQPIEISISSFNSDIPESEWNGVWISETEFSGGSTGTSDYFNINKMVKVLDSNGKKYLELKKGIRIEIPESVYSTLKTGAIEINEVAYIANNPIVSGFKSGNDYYVVFNTGIQLKISATDSATAKEIFEAIFVKANGYYTVNGTFYLDKEIFKVFSPKANVYIAEFKNGMQSGILSDEYDVFTTEESGGTPFDSSYEGSVMYFDTSYFASPSDFETWAKARYAEAGMEWQQGVAIDNIDFALCDLVYDGGVDENAQFLSLSYREEEDSFWLSLSDDLYYISKDDDERTAGWQGTIATDGYFDLLNGMAESSVKNINTIVQGDKWNGVFISSTPFA